jgi:urocanate hydratase
VNTSAVTRATRQRAARAPSGPDISCIGRQREAALRILMNNLGAEVAETPSEPLVTL